MTGPDRRNLRFGRFEIDPVRCTLTRDGAPQPLQPLTFALLQLLASAEPGRVLSRAEIERELWQGTRVVDNAVNQVVKRARQVLGDLDPLAPTHLETVPRLGWRLTVPVARVEPADPGLFGRAAELARGEEALARGSVVLRGPAGAGKSRLARAIADRAPGRVVRVELGGLADAGDALGRIAEALGATGPDDLVAAVRAALATEPALLLLDETEALEPAFAEVLAELAPPARLLVTTRLGPLPAGAAVVDLGPLPADAAVRLFLARAAAPVADEGAVAELCALVDGNPLAIELLAPLARHLPLADLAIALQSSSAALGDDAFDRAQARSHDLLAPADRDALAALSVAEGAVDLASAELLVGPGAAAAIARLAALGLVEARDGRIRPFERVRLFARRRAEAAGTLGPATARWHADALARADRLQTEVVKGRPEAYGRLVPTLRAALAATDPERAVHAAIGLSFWYRVRGPRTAAAETLAQVVELRGAVGPPLRGRFALERATVEVLAGRYERALDAAAEAVAALDGVRPAGADRARIQQANAAMALGRPADAVALCEAVCGSARERGDDEAFVVAANALSAALLASRRPLDAARVAEAGSATAAAAGLELAGLSLRIQHAICLTEVDDLAGAAPLLAWVAARAAALGAARAQAAALVNLGIVRLQEGAPEAAARCFADARAAAGPTADAAQRVEFDIGRGLAALALGDAAGARAALTDARYGHGPIPKRWVDGLVATWLAAVDARDGVPGVEAALAAAAAALENAPRADAPATNATFRALLALTRGDRDAARTALAGVEVPAGPLGEPVRVALRGLEGPLDPGGLAAGRWAGHTAARWLLGGS